MHSAGLGNVTTPLNRARTRGLSQDVPAANETVRAVVEIIGIELVDRHPHRASARIGVHALVGMERIGVGHGLIGEIPAHHSLSRCRIVGLPDA